MSDKPSRLTQDAAAARELEALLDDIHGQDRPTVGNGTYRVSPRLEAIVTEVAAAEKQLATEQVWTHDEDGSYAEFPAHHLHVTTDGSVWLNTEVAGFDGLCIGLGEHCVEDAITTLERALSLMRAYKMVVR